MRPVTNAGRLLLTAAAAMHKVYDTQSMLNPTPKTRAMTRNLVLLRKSLADPRCGSCLPRARSAHTRQLALSTPRKNDSCVLLLPSLPAPSETRPFSSIAEMSDQKAHSDFFLKFSGVVTPTNTTCARTPRGARSTEVLVAGGQNACVLARKVRHKSAHCRSR